MKTGELMNRRQGHPGPIPGQCASTILATAQLQGWITRLMTDMISRLLVEADVFFCKASSILGKNPGKKSMHPTMPPDPLGPMIEV